VWAHPLVRDTFDASLRHRLLAAADALPALLDELDAAPIATAHGDAASEIWSAPAAPVQYAAALAFCEPAEICERIRRSRILHASVADAMSEACADAGLLVPPPQAAFYVYPDFGPWRDYLQSRYSVSTSTGLAGLLLQRYGAVTLPGSALGDRPGTLTLRLATARIYGNSADQQEAALAAPDPLTHLPIATALARFKEILANLTT
jgi:aspartate/methionine/tyrosine aminotransferase